MKYRKKLCTYQTKTYSDYSFVYIRYGFMSGRKRREHRINRRAYVRSVYTLKRVRQNDRCIIIVPAIWLKKRAREVYLIERRESHDNREEKK